MCLPEVGYGPLHACIAVQNILLLISMSTDFSDTNNEIFLFVDNVLHYIAGNVFT